MKADLDRLMRDRGYSAIIVAFEEQLNSHVRYLTNNVHITKGLVMKAVDGDPVIFCSPMEIEEAAKSGLKVLTFNELGWGDLLVEHGGDKLKAEPIFWGRCLDYVGVHGGEVGIYGSGDHNVMLAFVEYLRAALPQYTFVGEIGTTIFDEAYLTKDADEIARMRKVAEGTNATLAEAWDYIAGQQVVDGGLVKEDGTPLTIGDVRRFICRSLLDRDLEDTGMIFAQGRDGGYPHSRGEDGDQLRVGESIVFDLFPQEIGGGYFHDVTRTWALGYARPEVQEAYDQVMEAFDIAVELAKPGIETRVLQVAVMDYFESKGHATTRSNPNSMNGYVHSLGHGVGLNIHERPSLGHLSKDVLQKGNVVSVEPGLYYPEKGFGVRVEDTFYVNEDGEFESLTPFRKDLVIPLKNA